MAPERKDFLNLRDKPARFTAEETAIYLGFSPHDIPILVSRGLLKPLAVLAANTTKYFARVELDNLRTDVKWLSRATTAVYQFWRLKNARKTYNPSPSEQNGYAVDGTLT
jgi:hypothetical protein